VASVAGNKGVDIAVGAQPGRGSRRRRKGWRLDLGTCTLPVMDPRVRRARDFMDAHLGEPIRLGVLARHAGVSVPHLARLFRRNAGRPPHETLRLMRLAKAAELLSSLDLAIKEIAAAVGYADVSNFDGDFAREYGIRCRRSWDRRISHTSIAWFGGMCPHLSRVVGLHPPLPTGRQRPPHLL
jgi:transcriptional regulator GlxA family with amidase domain